MYVTGTIVDFRSRLHQFSHDADSYALFAAEAEGYWNEFTIQEQEKLLLEARKRNTSFTNDSSYWTVSGSSSSSPTFPCTWEPASFPFPETVGYFNWAEESGITSMTFDLTTGRAGFDLGLLLEATGVYFPNLTVIDPNNSLVGYVAIYNCPKLELISFPELTGVFGEGGFYIEANDSLTTMHMPKLNKVFSELHMQGNGSLVNLSFPELAFIQYGPVIFNHDSLTYVSLPNLTGIEDNFRVWGNPALTGVYIPGLIFPNGLTVDAHSNAFNQATVDHILARAVASTGYVNGQINLQSGNNAAPSISGQADIAILESRGLVVTTN